MIYELAVIGIGDIRQQDQGVGIYLLDSLQKKFKKAPIKFINGGVDGEDLFILLQKVVAKQIIVIDAAETTINPGSLNYLTITPNETKILEKLILITIEPFKTEWGAKLSLSLLRKYDNILAEVESNIKELLNYSFQ
ncbi:hypothetical protein [Selenihalanaerobacter shriftii]|uniref:Hydrogenase maturation protease n=1 Tax=Selenihalanaerobacter shriftii TaxID=142842 RepID=A0A1T4P595_9FIRM|nr:hypothetical protein [Selenihalanaerobacter shriftii]SJZ86725.1 Hydrogenase maturation protease [Selenihalanaerobacter shriftii]